MTDNWLIEVVLLMILFVLHRIKNILHEMPRHQDDPHAEDDEGTKSGPGGLNF